MPYKGASGRLSEVL